MTARTATRVVHRYNTSGRPLIGHVTRELNPDQVMVAWGLSRHVYPEWKDELKVICDTETEGTK